MGILKQVWSNAQEVCSLCRSKGFCLGCKIHLVVRGQKVVVDGLTKEIIDAKEIRGVRKTG